MLLNNVPSCNDSSNDSNIETMSAGYDSYTFHNFKVYSESAQVNAAVLNAQETSKVTCWVTVEVGPTGTSAEPQSGLHPDYQPL